MVDIRQKEKDFKDWKQDVWDDWWEGEGNCSECPIRCENRGSFPNYGAFNPDADVMLVGREPGAKSRFVVEDVSGKPRKYRTVPSEEVREPPRQYNEYPYDQKILAEWSFFWEGPAKLLGVRNEDQYGGDREVVDRHPRQTYFTNALKCSRLPSSPENIEEEIDDPSALNEEARGTCRSYLREEIDLVNPDVVVAFGQETFTHVMATLDRDDKSDQNLKSIMNNGGSDQITTYGDEPTVVPSYHWSGRFFATNMRNASAVPDNASVNECWSVLARTVNTALTNSSG